jgi:hypothetical protein
MHTLSISLTANAGGLSTKLAISAVSAQSIACTGSSVVLTPDTTCFFRMGANPTALADGTDQILLANNTYRVTVSPGQKLAFIAGAAGNVYITQEP